MAVMALLNFIEFTHLTIKYSFLIFYTFLIFSIRLLPLSNNFQFTEKCNELCCYPSSRFAAQKNLLSKVSTIGSVRELVDFLAYDYVS